MFQMEDIGQIPTTQFNLPQPKKGGGGMFGGGGKFGLKEALAFGLAGFMARRNPMLLQGLMGSMMQKQQGEQEDQRYQRQREDGLTDYRAKLGIQQEFAQPEMPSFAKDLMAAGYQPGTPDFNRLYGQYVQQRAQSGGSLLGNLFKDPATGQQYMPGNLPPLGEEIDDPRKQGGPSPLGSGGFPGPF